MTSKPYINCFTGSISHILNSNSAREENILALGGGFLLKTSQDEYGFPELTFKVEVCGLNALNYFDIDYDEMRIIDRDFNLDSLNHQLQHICWVNSRHLLYSSTYSKSLGYQHALVLEKIDSDIVNIFDPLIVDIPPYATYAQLNRRNMIRALTDQVSSETEDLVGKVYSLDTFSIGNLKPIDKKKLFENMKEQYFYMPEYNQAIQEYLDYNVSLLNPLDEEYCKLISRRIFDHVQVLYVLPVLTLLSRHQWKPDVAIILDKEQLEWKRLAMMALKNSKVFSNRLTCKIVYQLNVCRIARTKFWESI